MHDLPHHYKVAATAGFDTDVSLTGDRLEAIASAPPEEFGGPGDKWSPETLLVAAVADCFILTFRAIARASEIPWISLKCDVEGILDRPERTTRFTDFVVHATLEVPADVDEKRAHWALEKAERGCLVTNSLSSNTHLEATVLKGS